ncbi:SirB2 family protein [Alkalilimnicola ehrlichii MLHE-1]|uniref:Invasion gene expression up-regulator, SirB n=1 Tax=Alkalilimnicola ehrlichii (strain ATCC BAA-1101 / DSM 17681 / MLHE-1) TaxID=187272 RepID=Q0ACI6_ALKEH|nr:SirB2 family protein [Alkalilimnicola ehrlichii]ABI55451.1 Invasion gene expression up-regulator, SirB [Alkalilimnicola ehrlichii MLHE-1]
MLPAELYFPLKHTHMLMAIISIALFVLRGLLLPIKPELLANKAVRIVPHIFDTVLLLTALGLLAVLSLNPFAHGWIMAKIIGLILYIVLGTIALRRGRTPVAKAVAFFAAVFTFAYIYAVALTRTPLPFIG